MIIKILGNPIPKKRAKHTQKNGLITTYDPQSKDKLYVKNKMYALLCNFNEDEVKKITCAKYLYVSFIFCLPIPKSDSKVVKIEKLWGFRLASSKPDIDNLEKFYLDCASGILWSDDRIVVSIKSDKIYGKTPYVEIKIQEKRSLDLSEKWSEIIKCFTPDELDMFLHDANEMGAYFSSENFYASEELKKEYLEKVAEMIEIFVANHAGKIKDIKRKI